MAPLPIESFQEYIVRNNDIRFYQSYIDRISEKNNIDIEQVTLFDVAKNEYIDDDLEQPLKKLYKYELSNKQSNKPKIMNYPDQPMRSPLTVESLRNFVNDEYAQYPNRSRIEWRRLIKSTKILYRCLYCKTYHVRSLTFFVDSPSRYKDGCPLCLYSYDVIQHGMNEIGFDVEGDEKAWNTRNAGKIGSHASFNLLYNDCDCTQKCRIEIKKFEYWKEKLPSIAHQKSTDGTYFCPKKSGAGFNEIKIGDFGEEYIKNTVLNDCRNHDLPGRIIYAFECGPADVIFGIANDEKHKTKYDIMYIQIQIKTKSGYNRWKIENNRSYPDDVLGILLNIDKKSEDANVDLVFMETWKTLTSDITVVEGKTYYLYETKMLDYEIADISEITRAIMMFYYEAKLKNKTLTYEEAFRPWPNHHTVRHEFKSYQSTEKTNRKWCVYGCFDSPYKKVDNTLTMKVRVNDDEYTKAIYKKLFYEIAANPTEGFAIIRINDQSKSWNGKENLKFLKNLEHPIYEGAFAENLGDQVNLFHWYERSSDENYLIPFANVRHYVNTDKKEKKIKYSSVIKKLFDEDGNWQQHFKEYSYKYDTEIPIRLLSKVTGLKAADILRISIIDLPEEQKIGFLDTKEILLKTTDWM